MKTRCVARVASLLVVSLLIVGWMSFPLVSVLAQTPHETTKNAEAVEREVHASLPVFDVASVRPNNSSTAMFGMRFTADGVSIHNASLLMIIRASHGMFNSLDDKFVGIPGWAKSKRFDIEAKVSGADAETFRKLDFDKRQLMVQAMLTDRFKLHAHDEVLVQPVYLLALAKRGPKLGEAKLVEGADPGGTIKRTRGQILGEDVVVSQLVSALTQELGRTVVDETGLKGKYDFTLQWTPEDMAEQKATGLNGTGEAGDATGPSIFTAIQEQLGLKLEPAKRPVECLVIDHVEMPSEN